MTNNQIILQTAKFVKEKMAGEGTGHDFWHIQRVRNMAIKIAKKEKADFFIVELAALLHDIGDWKFNNGDSNVGVKVAKEYLQKMGIKRSVLDEILHIVGNISYKGGTNMVKMRSLEGKIVQDADRLDALGAIGIARTFAYGGFRQREIYNPNKKPRKYVNFTQFKNSITDSTTVNHFYEKLLLLKDLMHTNTAKQIAKKRHKYLEQFLEQFYAEWDGRE